MLTDFTLKQFYSSSVEVNSDGELLLIDFRFMLIDTSILKKIVKQ